MAVQTKIASPTRRMAEFIARASYDDLPQEVRHAAKRYILDSITNQIGGSRIQAGKIILEVFEEMGGKPESTILATGKKVPCLHAAYVNSALNNLLDFDDCYLYISHPGATIVPVAVSLGEKLGSTGTEMINAVTLGYEISLRVCDAIRGTHERFEQVWGMATWQIFGAVTVAAKLMKLNTDQVATALGHAGMSAPVPFLRKAGLEPEDRPFSMLKNNFGWASMGGVLAATLAAKGLQGNQNIFDGPKGFWVMAGSDQCDFETLTKGLGKEYLMPMTGIKPYAACRWTQSTLGALEEITASNKVDATKVRSISVKSMTPLCDTFGVYKPAHIIDTQFALPPLIALTLAGYSPSHGIAEDHINDRLVQDLTNKVKIEVAPDADRRFHELRQQISTVTIEMTDGKRYQNTRTGAKGEPDCPLTDDELKAKFLDVTVPIVGKKQADHIVSQVDRLETLDNVGTIAGKAKRG